MSVTRANRRRADRNRNGHGNLPDRPDPGIQLPPEIQAALTAQIDPYSLLGQAQARVVQLENVVSVMIRYLTTLAQQQRAPQPEAIAHLETIAEPPEESVED